MSVVKKMLKDAQKTKDSHLNLNSLLDMLTLLVVFLMKSMSATVLNPPPPEIRLPTSYVGDEPKEALMIQVSSNYITINNKKLVVLKDGKFIAEDLSKNDLYLVPAIEKELLEEAERSKNIEKQTKELFKFKGTAFIQIDKGIEYATVKRILYTSSVAGYGDMKLATVGSGE